MRLLKNPTDVQRQVITAGGNLLVIGGPGSGKTTVALAKAVDFIETRGVGDYESVLFLSFSNAAVHRIREAARDAIPRRILRRIETTTFHGFCYSVIAAHRRLIGLQQPFRLFPPEDEANLRSRITDATVADEYERLERVEGRVRFDRFTALTVRLFETQPLIASAYAQAYPLIMVDEYQDTSDEQDRLVQLLGSRAQVLYLGDPDQRIYDYVPGTRSDRLARTAAREGIGTIHLLTNHRNAGTDIAEYGRAVLQGAPRVERPKCVGIRKFGNTRAAQVSVLKREVFRLEEHLSGRLPPGVRPSIAIMARTNDLVRLLSASLLTTDAEWKWPFRHQVLLAPDAVAIAWDAIMVLLEPNGSDDGRSADVLRAAARLNRLKVNKVSRIAQAQRLERWGAELDAGRLSSRATAVNELRRRVRDFIGGITGNPTEDCNRAREVFRGLPGNCLDQLVAVLDLRPPTGGMTDLSGVLGTSYLDRGAYQDARKASEAALLRERMEIGSASLAPRVLMTMHKCKGKQFDGVIIVDAHHPPNRLYEGAVPDARRLLHVAITRASMRTVILTPSYQPCPLLPALG